MLRVNVRRPLIFGIIFGLALFGSSAPRAQQTDLRWEVMADGEKAIVDRLAADFYEQSLRQSQADAIERHTAEIYAEASPGERARFRARRRAQWEAMDEAERASLHSVERPLFRNLTEEQKTPFRQYALDRLSGVGAIDRDALATALRNDI